MKLQHNKWLDYACMAAGSLLMAVGIQFFYDPIGLVTGGVSGIAIILKELTGLFPLGITTIVLNIPLFYIGWRVFGWKYISKTVVCTTMLSVWLTILPTYALTPDDYFLSAVFGGVIFGIGIGLVFYANATTGGTDLLAAIIRKRVPHYSIAQIMQLIDGVIVIAGACVFGIEAAMYAVITVFLISKVSDSMLEGMKFAKMLYIISDKHEEIAAYIMHELDRGVTGLYGQGLYSGNDRKVLICVVSKKEIVSVKERIAQIDPNAFVILSDAREVLGEGFIHHNIT